MSPCFWFCLLKAVRNVDLSLSLPSLILQRPPLPPYLHVVVSHLCPHYPSVILLPQVSAYSSYRSPGLCHLSDLAKSPPSCFILPLFTWLRCGSPGKPWALVPLLSVPIACHVLCTVLSASTTATSSFQVGHGGRGWPSFSSFPLVIRTAQNTCPPSFSSLAHSYPLSLMCNIISLAEFFLNLQPML